MEGDDKSALHWLLSADVERAALIEDEARLSHYVNEQNELEEGRKQQLPADLKGVNLEKALEEVSESNTNNTNNQLSVVTITVTAIVYCILYIVFYSLYTLL